MCGSRQEAYDDFTNGLGDDKYERIVLLVDSEVPVSAGDTAWEHLQKCDKWAKPAGAQEDGAHLMVQCMESWFMADKECLAVYYGQGFNENALPQNSEVEKISKRDLQGGLKSATRQTTKGAYKKVEHGFDILGLIRPARVEEKSSFADRLHAYLKS